MFRQPKTVQDGRGVHRKICMIQEAVSVSGIPVEVLAGREDRAAFWRSVLSTGGLFTVAMVPAQGIVFSVMFGWNAFIQLLPFVPVYFLGFGIPMGLVSTRYGWRSPKHARHAMLLHDLCPACAHGLCGIPPQSDGCVVCPECGASWRMQASVSDKA